MKFPFHWPCTPTVLPHFSNEYSGWLFLNNCPQWMAALNHWVSMALLNEYLWPDFVLVFTQMNFPFITLIHTLPSLTGWHFLYDRVSMTLPNEGLLSWHLYECISHLIALIHRLPSLTDWCVFPIWIPSHTDCPPSPIGIFSMSTVGVVKKRVITKKP